MSSAAHSTRSDRSAKPETAQDDASYLPREADNFTPAARYARVGAERNAAAAQIQRSLRVWRKAADENEKKENEEEEKKGESEEGEEKEAGEKEGEEKDGPEKDGAEKEPPPIQAKLQGVGLKIFRAAEGNQKDSGVVARAQRMIDAGEAKDMEDALNKLYAQSSGEERNKVKRTQKAFGFRHSRHS